MTEFAVPGWEDWTYSWEEAEANWPGGWEPNWILHGLLQRNGINFILGAPKSHKSQLRRYLLACAISGTSAWEAHTAAVSGISGICLVVEDHPGAERVRLHTMLASMGYKGPKPKLFFMDTRLKRFNLLHRPDLGKLLDTVKRLKVDLVTIDPLINFHTADENNASEMGRVMEALHALSTYTTVLVVHHTSKPGEFNVGRTVGERARGSSALAGAAQSTILVERTARTGYVHKLSFEMKSAETPDPIMLHLDWETGIWYEEEPLSDDKVLKFVFAHPGLRKQDIIAQMPGRDSEVRKILSRLIKEKRVRVRKGESDVRGPKPELIYPSVDSGEATDEN